MRLHVRLAALLGRLSFGVDLLGAVRRWNVHVRRGRRVRLRVRVRPLPGGLRGQQSVVCGTVLGRSVHVRIRQRLRLPVRLPPVSLDLRARLELRLDLPGWHRRRLQLRPELRGSSSDRLQRRDHAHLQCRLPLKRPASGGSVLRWRLRWHGCWTPDAHGYGPWMHTPTGSRMRSAAAQRGPIEQIQSPMSS